MIYVYETTENNLFYFVGNKSSKNFTFAGALAKCRFLKSIGIELNFDWCETDMEMYI